MSTKPVIATGIIYHHTNDTTISYQIDSVQSKPSKVIKFCFGFNHMILLKERGFIQKISSNDTIFDKSYDYLMKEEININDIAFGKKHALVLTKQGNILSFGDNSFGQLGIGMIGAGIIIKPHRIKYFDLIDSKIVEIKCGENHSVALTNKGYIYTFGSGKYGQLGTKILSLQMVPRYVASINTNIYIKHISCGPHGTACISSNGDLYQWGFGQSEPIKILISHVKIRKISMGYAHTLCLTQCGKLYGWGLCQYGQLGQNAHNTKKIVTPLLLKEFINFNITDIECCGLYTVIKTNDKIFILGFNDSLFNKKQNIKPYQLILTNKQRLNICYFGCSRYDFAVIVGTKINKISPIICLSSGSNIEISGHGFYSTSFEPKVKFIIIGIIEIIINAQLITTQNKTKWNLSVTTPNFDEINIDLNFPLNIKVAVSMDGHNFSEPFNFNVIQHLENDDITFPIIPNCGDIYGDLKCKITDKSDYNYIIKLLSIKDIEINNIKIKFVAIMSNNRYIINGELDDENQCISFITSPMNQGQYKIYIAFDGQKYINTNCKFTVYNVKCLKCKPENIILSKYNETLEMEIEVDGFIKSKHYKDNKIQFIHNSSSFITDCIYQSQSLRDIVIKEAEIAKKFEAQRQNIENEKIEQLKELEIENKEQDKEREKWLNQIEKDRKKKKKQEDIQLFEGEIAKQNDEWNDRLKERENKQREIKREYKKKIWNIDLNEMKLEKEEEIDNGHGYIKCNVDINILKKWINPCNIQIKVTSNNIIFSDLCSIECINPEIKEIEPKNGLFSESIPIKMFISGFNLNQINKDDIKISIQDIDENNVEIKKFEIKIDKNTNDSYIGFMIDALSKEGEKKINLKYKEDIFNISTLFLSHNNNLIKISDIEPKTFVISEGGEMKIKFENQLDSKYFDALKVEIKANDKSVMINTKMNENQKECKIRFCNNPKINELEIVGATKKAQVSVSFNLQQWIVAKSSIVIK